MNLNLEVVTDTEVKINGKSYLLKKEETVEEEYERKVKTYKNSHSRQWKITVDNCHLIGLNRREFKRFIAIPKVAEYVDKEAIGRDVVFKIIKRMPYLYSSIADINCGGLFDEI